jgi:hypothetical protein
MTKTINLATISARGGPMDLCIYEWAQPKDQRSPVSAYPRPAIIANVGVPDIGGFDYASVHRIGNTFLVVCSPGPDRFDKIHVRVHVVRPDDNIVSNGMTLCEGMQSTDKLLMCPYAGRILVVTNSSILIFDL